VFDYRIGAWSVWNICPVAGVGLAPIGAAVRPGGSYTIVTADGKVRYALEGTFTESAGGTVVWIPLAIETSAVQAAQQSGWQRAWCWVVLLEKRTKHALVAKLYSDFQTTPDATRNITSATIETWPEIASREQPRFEIVRQLSQAQRIRLEDAPDDPARPDGTGEGIAFISATLEVGVKRSHAIVAKAARS
jgi:hypothetical protein